MSNILYTLVNNEGDASVTVFVPGQPPLIAGASHPNFKLIVNTLIDGTDDSDLITDLFDVGATIIRRLDRLTDRVTVQDGVVCFDGDPIRSAISEQILRLVRSGSNDYLPLARFMENLAANPQAHSRDQFYEWLTRHDFTITPEGNVVGYKGVQRDAEHGFVSISRGPAVVDGKPVNGNVPNYIGATVELARGQVEHAPTVGCASGLHVGTWQYAHGFSRGAVLEVHFNPRDVVSVPTDCNAQKVRVCRYTVVNILDVPYTAPVLGGPSDSFEDDDFVPDSWFEDVPSDVESEAREAARDAAEDVLGRYGY